MTECVGTSEINGFTERIALFFCGGSSHPKRRGGEKQQSGGWGPERARARTGNHRNGCPESNHDRQRNSRHQIRSPCNSAGDKSAKRSKDQTISHDKRLETEGGGRVGINARHVETAELRKSRRPSILQQQPKMSAWSVTTTSCSGRAIASRSIPKAAASASPAPRSTSTTRSMDASLSTTEKPNCYTPWLRQGDIFMLLLG